jgi:hypothetical protein
MTGTIVAQLRLRSCQVHQKLQASLRGRRWDCGDGTKDRRDVRHTRGERSQHRWCGRPDAENEPADRRSLCNRLTPVARHLVAILVDCLPMGRRERGSLVQSCVGAHACICVLALLSSCTLTAVVTNLLAASRVSAQPAPGELEAEAEEARRALDVFLREEQILLRRGELALELDTLYATGTRDRFVTNIAGAPLAEVTNWSVTTFLIPRYGLLDNLELDVEIPFGWAEQELDFGTTRSRTSDVNVGDIAATLRYQLWLERGARPALALELRGKSITGGDTLLGTGHWNVDAGISVVKTLDPVVFFGRLGYTVAFERNGVDPGDQVRYLFGMGYSLNDRVSFSMRVGGAYVGQAKQNGKAIPRSSLDIVSLQFNVTTRVARHWFVEPFVNAGLTDDAPDAIIGVSVLYLFSAAWRQR